MDATTAARMILAHNGTENPHPALLGDTVREVEYHGVEAALEAVGITAPVEDTIEVVKDVHEVPCEHVACDLMHRHLYNEEIMGGPTLITVYNMEGRDMGLRYESRFHMIRRTQWVVLVNGERVGDAHDRKRDAVAEAMRLHG